MLKLLYRFVDVAEMMANVAAFHINDLDTLSVLTAASGVLGGGKPSTNLLNCVLPSLTNWTSARLSQPITRLGRLMVSLALNHR